MSEDMQFLSWDFAPSDPLSKAFYELFKDALEAAPECMFDHKASDFLESTIFALQAQDGEMVSGHASFVDEDGILNFASAVTKPTLQKRGYMTQLLGFSIKATFDSGFDQIIAHIREFEDGTMNEGSNKTFTGRGFKHHGNVLVCLKEDENDAHLLPTANARGEIKGRRLVLSGRGRLKA